MATESSANSQQNPLNSPAPAPSPSDPPKQIYEPSKVPPSVWVMTTNFAEGLPFMIVRILSSVFFTDIGVKERYLGYLNFFGIPWNFKFLWSPIVDIFSTKRRWMVVIQGLISILTMAIAMICYSIPAEGDPSKFLLLISVIFVGMAFIAATNDISIDAYYLEGLRDKTSQAAYSGYRVMAYRLSMIFARSGLVALAAYVGNQLGGTNKYLPWAYAFAGGALVMILLSLFHQFFVSDFVTKQFGSSSAKEKMAAFGNAFTSYLQQDRVVLILAFIITYKVGDEILFSMVTPFLMRELGINKAQYSWIAGIVGAWCTVIGAMLGAWWIKKYGLKRAIWPLTLMMNVNMWAYIWLAWVKPNPNTNFGLSLIAIAHGYEQIAAGLGSAALTVFMMRTCKPDFKAAHYAIGSAIMSIPATFIGGFGGWIVESIGYLNLFILAFFASIPSMIMLTKLPIAEEDQPVTK